MRPGDPRMKADEMAMGAALQRMSGGGMGPLKKEAESMEAMGETCECPKCGYSGPMDEFMSPGSSPAEYDEGDIG